MSNHTSWKTQRRVGPMSTRNAIRCVRNVCQNPPPSPPHSVKSRILGLNDITFLLLLYAPFFLFPSLLLISCLLPLFPFVLHSFSTAHATFWEFAFFVSWKVRKQTMKTGSAPLSFALSPSPCILVSMPLEVQLLVSCLYIEADGPCLSHGIV